MENISEELITKLTKITELENKKLQINAAIFLKKITEKYEISLKEIELRLDEEIEFYGQKPESYLEYKNSTIQKYSEELNKVCKEYELQFINICEELQETYANQKIAMANAKKMKNLKDDFLVSEKYQEYKQLKAEYKEKMDNSLTKVDFEKNMNILKNLTNPIDDFDNKIKASITKARDYENIIIKCTEKMQECTIQGIEKLNNFVYRKTSQLQIYSQKNIFSKIINKITNIFKGKEKLQKYVIDKTVVELQNLETDANNEQENTKENTIKFIEQLLILREELNNKFKEAVNG